MTINRSSAKEFRDRQVPAEDSDNHNHNILLIKKRKAGDFVYIIILAGEAAETDETKRNSLTKVKAKT